MNSPRVRSLSVLALALTSAAACTAILAPKDGVQRCGSADDCDPTGDERYVPVCRFDPENTDLDSTKVDKICVAEYDFKGCSPENRQDIDGETHPLPAQIDACDGVAAQCEDALLGTKGCAGRVSGQACDDGLELDDDGICVDEDDDVKIIDGAKGENSDQAVLDQFCRGFYCDERFVCNTDTNKCQLCNEDDEFGKGGCGEVWIGGAPHPTYLMGDALDDACDDEDSDVDAPNFGTCP